jgi:hypothetical protein
MITGDGSVARCGEAAAIEPPLANVMASLLMVERGAELGAGVVLLIQLVPQAFYRPPLRPCRVS